MVYITPPADQALPESEIVFDLEKPRDFTYRDCDGKPIRSKHRPRNGPKYWLGDKKTAKKVTTLYRTEKLEAAKRAGAVIFALDGETDVDAANSAFEAWGVNALAVCAPHGMANWKDHHSEQLRGSTRVIVVADQDTAANKFRGQQDAVRAKESLERTLGQEVAVVESQAGKDARDHFTAGYAPHEFKRADPASEPYRRSTSDPKPKPEAGESSDISRPLWRIVKRLEAMPELELFQDTPTHWRSRCPLPTHDDKNASFAIGKGEDRPIVVTCSGCNATVEEFAAFFDEDRRDFSRPNSVVEPSAEPIPGGTFILDGDTKVGVLWGRGEKVLWAKDEGLLIVGPQGVGKSTVIQQVALRACGVLPGTFLGYPVEPVEGLVVYLAMDRPKQIKRSLYRMVSEEDREVLDRRLIVWPRPLSTNILKEPDGLVNWLEEKFAKFARIGAVIVDSYKDLAPGLSQDDVGSRVNLAAKAVIARGIQWAGLHHQRKAHADNKRPDKLSDVYGAESLTAGMGSVVLLWGQPGSVNVELRHLKQPMEDVGPLALVHDHQQGRTMVSNFQQVLLNLLNEDHNAGDRGVEEGTIAVALYGIDD